MLSVDILKSVIFLNGKLKEMTDKLHGPEAWQKMRFDRPHELVEMLDDLLNGNDETSSDIVRGLSLHDASRHRPDIDHPMPLHSLDVFKDPSLASLRRFAHTAPKKLIDFWQAAAVECLLGSTVQAFLSFLEDETNGSREVLTVKALVEDLVLALRPVVADRGETMSTEPSMVFANMKESSERGWNGQPKDSDSSFRWMVVATWCSEREEDIIAIMESNVEERGRHDTPLWGAMDEKHVRVKVSHPIFNFVDFLTDFVDFAYDKGYVFKPSANSPLDWSNQEVVQWVANLKLKQYVDNCRASGITGLPLLEATKVDLEITLGIFDTKDKEKLWQGLQTLRDQVQFEPMHFNTRETQRLVTLQVPEGAKGGETMVVPDPAGKPVKVAIPEMTMDQTEWMEAGMAFKQRFTFSHTVLNKWQAARNQQMKPIGGSLIKQGQERTPANFWKGAINKVKVMNMLESKVNRRLRMSQTDEQVRLTAMDLTPKDASSLADFLVVNATVKRLELSFNRMGPEGCAILVKALKENRTVSEIRMSNNNIGDKGATTIAQMLLVNEHVFEIDLGSNNIGEAGGVALLDAGGRSPPVRDALGHKVEGTHVLQRIMLYSNLLGEKACAAWGKCLKRNPKIEVDMTENNVSEGGLAYIAGFLRKFWVHPRLDLRSMGFGADGMRPLSLQLADRRMRTVTTLYLSNNELGPEGAMHLAHVLERSYSLQELDVSGCGMEDEGVRVVAEALQLNQRLEYMDLGDNRLTDTAVQLLATMLATKAKRAQQSSVLFPFSLKRIVLSSNNITSNGFGLLSAALTSSRSTHCEVAHCQVRDDGCRVMAQHLENNKCLRVIDISSNLLTADGLWVMAEALRNNGSVEILRLNDNRLFDSGGRALASILKYNHWIKEVNVSGNGIGTKGVIPITKVLMHRRVGLELWMHGNTFHRDKEATDAIARLERKNQCVAVYQ